MQQTDLDTHEVRILRQSLTPAEQQLWQALRNRRFLGLKVRRQVPLGGFVAPFLCVDHRLVIDPDPSVSTDLFRDRWLRHAAYRYLPLAPDEVLADLPCALARIAAEIAPVIDPSAPI